jgi:hypothetical protein
MVPFIVTATKPLNIAQNTGGQPPKISPSMESRVHKTKQCQQVQKHVPPPPLVLKRERNTLYVPALSQFSITKKKIIIKSEGIHGTIQAYWAIIETQKSHLCVLSMKSECTWYNPQALV